MLFRKTLLWLLPLISVEAFAVQGGPELDRNLVSLYSEGEGEIWGQVDYVDDSFNVFGYGSTTSGLTYSQAALVGGKVGLSDQLNLQAQYEQHEDEVWRSAEPKITQSRYTALRTELQKVFYMGTKFDLAWSMGYRKHTSTDGEIKKFQFGKYLIEAGSSSLEVSGLASINNTQLSFELDGVPYSLSTESESTINLNDSYVVSQLENSTFQIDANGKVNSVTDLGAALRVTTPSVAVAEISPHDDAVGHDDALRLEADFGGTTVIAYLESGPTAETVDIYTNADMTGAPITLQDASVPGTDVNTGDLLALLEIERSLGILSLPKAASNVSSINQVLSTIDTNYIVKADPQDETWQLGLTGAWYPYRDYRITMGSEFRTVHIEPNYRINAGIVDLLEIYKDIGFDDRATLALAEIDDQLPQQSGWDETHVVLSAGVDWDAYEDLSFAAEYTFYNISRSGYQSTQGKVAPGVEDQTTNHQLDGWLFIKPETDITLYIHGRAYSNFLLGDRPLLYNARVNHKFTDPYGFVSVGAVWEF